MKQLQILYNQQLATISLLIWDLLIIRAIPYKNYFIVIVY